MGSLTSHTGLYEVIRRSVGGSCVGTLDQRKLEGLILF